MRTFFLPTLFFIILFIWVSVYVSETTKSLRSINRHNDKVDEILSNLNISGSVTGNITEYARMLIFNESLMRMAKDMILMQNMSDLYTKPAVNQVNSGIGLTNVPIGSTVTLGLANTTVSPGGYTNPVLQIDAQGRVTSATNGTVNGVGAVTLLSSGTGLTGGPINSTGTIHLANTAVAPGGYMNPVLQIDQQGRITSATNGTTVTLVTSGTGLTGGTINSTGTISLSNTTVTPGGYSTPVLQIDAQGRITSATNGTVSGAGTVTLVNSGTGLTGGPINSTGTLHLADTTVTPGGYMNPVVQIDQQGRITSATNGTFVTLVASGTGLTGGPINSTGTLHLADTTVTPGGYTNPVLQIDQQGRITSATNGTTVTLVTSGTGLTGGSINSTGTLSLSNTTVTPGGYTNPVLQIDQQGRITSATNGTVSGMGTVTLINSGPGLTGGPINSTGTLHLVNTTVIPGTYTYDGRLIILNINQYGCIIGITMLPGQGTIRVFSGDLFTTTTPGTLLIFKIQRVSISINHVIPPVNYFNMTGIMVISENSPPINQINIDSFTFKRTGRISLFGNASINQFMYDMFNITNVNNVVVQTCTTVVASELIIGGTLSHRHCRSFRNIAGMLTPISNNLYYMNVTEGSLLDTILEIVPDNPTFSLSYNLQSPNINNLNILLVFDTDIIVAF